MVDGERSKRTGKNVIKRVLDGLRVSHGAIAQQYEAERSADKEECRAASKQHGEWMRARQVGESGAHRRFRWGLVEKGF
jgi:hypothetical protein